MNNDVKRIGVIAPPANVALERELPRYLPDGVVTNHNRLSRPEAKLTKESLLAMGDSAMRAATDLAYARPDVVMYGCTSGSFLDGFGNETKIADRITGLIGVPAFTTSTAVLEALRAVGARRVFMVTPYPEDMNEHEVKFLAHHGFEVPAYDSFRCAVSEQIRAIPSEDVAALVLRNRDTIAGCDAVFISCTNLLVLDQIEALEEVLGVPVVTSNQASLWAALRRLQVPTSSIACGRLFR
ncbi:maleate cis-trans isomerase [Roseomonas terrae]|jgi:maleate isomerase|uniref:Maleate cis-trans isomerase n=1 Tax=Neoroseomonas terrae TaxID=424799 RepID=A0ABS5EAV5_9PROT|nr:aspartate/glutamate racemase family protein [Neoroseomonas terrae]MBR0648159.1 maleate cis-trans isomerase [Neoroseomonas terrae]